MLYFLCWFLQILLPLIITDKLQLAERYGESVMSTQMADLAKPL